MATMATTPPLAQGPAPAKLQTPQDVVDNFWSKFSSKAPGKAMRVIPQNQHAERLASRNTPQSPSTTAQASYDRAAATCRAKVDKIVRECRRINKRYRDPHFDLETDLALGVRDSLESLSRASRKDAKNPGAHFQPRSAKRVVDIFDRPQFYIDGPTNTDVKQGRAGDCWFVSALCALSNKKGLIEKLCIAHDQEVGVYGFVFYRDGEWISEIIDDFLYLAKPDYDKTYLDELLTDELERTNPEKVYRRLYQSNSSALYFAQCQHPLETWLPLLEKAYAKAHGDYAAIEGGFNGEGIEDLTGGVTSEIFTADILDKERFWGELLRVNQDFLFGCSAGGWDPEAEETDGIVVRHAYSIQKAVEIDEQRILHLKNPWGSVEWKGPWSDGSQEWTPELREKLGHKFGDDGDFWISYEDLLRKFHRFDRTRLFGSDWHVAQIWTTLVVPWTVDYHETHFTFSIAQPGPVVIVLSQLDDRYFGGLQGQYCFELAFRVHKAGHEDYLVRSQAPYFTERSVNVELDLEEGEYQVLVKIKASRDEDYLPIDKVIRNNIKERVDKLIRIGLAYDLAHGKGRFVESPEEKRCRERRERADTVKRRQEAKTKFLSSREEAYYLKMKTFQRNQRRQAKKKNTAKKTEGKDGGDFAPDLQHLILAEDDLVPPTKEAHMSESPSAIANDENPFVLPSGRNHGDTANDGEGDLDSLESLSILSDRELDIHVNALLDDSKAKVQKETPDTPSEKPETPDEFETDPWNAAVVVGLRVYYKASEGDSAREIVKLNVVRPSLLDTGSADERKRIRLERKGTGLDVDDSAKDATMEGGVKERQKDILGDTQRERR